MEPISQALLGAAVGELGGGRTLGRRASLWGALIGMSPDLDVVAGPLHAGFGELLYHRGTTHSLWFGFVAGPLVAWLLWRWRDGAPGTLAAWRRVAILALVTHPLLDGFTPYGTQFFAPFWRERFAFHGIGILDPLYTLPLAVAVFALRRRGAGTALGRRAVIVGLCVSTAYLFAGVALNQFARSDARSILALDADASVRAYPTLLQPFLRRIVATRGDALYVGWHTTLRPGCIAGDWVTPPPDDERSRELRSTWQGEMMTWFALDDVAISIDDAPDGSAVIRIEDLRYGTPSQEPGQSMWGVEARYAPDGSRSTPVRRFRRGFDQRAGPSSLFRATLGATEIYGTPLCR